MRVAVDVMGGDHAPDAILKGCLDALTLLAPEDRLILVGDSAVIRDVMHERAITDPRVEIEHASQVIAMDDPPAKAVRSKPDSSLVRMAHLGSVKAEKRADVVLSAGNTGACVSAAILHMKRLPHVVRPGIAVTIPAFHGPVVLCDAGSNPEPKARHLWQYALMAETYSSQLLKVSSPRVALMNIGSEEAKGTGIIKEARDLMKATPDLNFIGFVEGRDFFDGVADVIITDGFVGNTLLKMAEGLAASLFTAIAHEIMTIDPELGMKFEPIVKQIYARNDYHEHGGAPLLGVNGGFMCAHGSSKPRTIRSAIRVCREFVQAGVNDAIVRRLEGVAHLSRPEPEGELA